MFVLKRFWLRHSTIKMATKEALEALQKQLKELQTQVEARPGVAQEPVRVIFPPRERKIKKFCGTQSKGEFYPLSDFVDELNNVFSARGNLSEAEKADFILSNLEGAARDEIKCLATTSQKNSREILKVLGKVFGEKLSLPQLMTKFYSCRQGHGDSLQQYCRSLLQLGRRVSSAGGDVQPVLRDVFAENIREVGLRRELKRQIRSDPTVTFDDLREAADHWEVDSGDKSKSTVSLHEQEAASEQDSGQQTLAQVVQQQQKLMAEMVQTLKGLQESMTKQAGKGKSKQEGTKKTPLRDSEGQLICYNCGEAGHIGRDCPKGKRVQCNRCKKYGHKAAECRSKKAVASVQEQQQDDTSSDSESENCNPQSL